MQIIPTQIDDPRLRIFADLKATKKDRAFVGEGRLVSERIMTSDYPVESLLISTQKLAWVESWSGCLTGTPVYTVDRDSIEQLVGFPFHSGILTAGRRGLPAPMQQAIQQWEDPTVPATLLALPHLDLAENLGSLLRSTLGLGGQGVLLDRRAPDYLGRRVLRVSMGHALRLPVQTVTASLVQRVRELKQCGFRVVVLEAQADMVPLSQAEISKRQVLVLGNEFDGVSGEWWELADQVVGVPMASEVDSLNVAVMGALALHHFCAPVR